MVASAGLLRASLPRAGQSTAALATGTTPALSSMRLSTNCHQTAGWDLPRVHLVRAELLLPATATAGAPPAGSRLALPALAGTLFADVPLDFDWPWETVVPLQRMR